MQLELPPCTPSLHFQDWKNVKLTADDIERFITKTYKDENGVLRWGGYIDKPRNHGIISIRGKPTTAHKVAWIVAYGDIPAGYKVRHKGDTTRDIIDVRFLECVPDRMASCLTEEQIAEICVDQRTQREIAIEYGVALSVVAKLRSQYHGHCEDGYSISEVMRMLNNYAEMRAAVEFSTAREVFDVSTQQSGSSNNKEPTLFRRTRHAHANMVRTKPNRRESLHVALMDLEAALPMLSGNDLGLVMRACLLQSDDKKALALEYGCKDESALYGRIRTIAGRLARIMNDRD